MIDYWKGLLNHWRIKSKEEEDVPLNWRITDHWRITEEEGLPTIGGLQRITDHWRITEEGLEEEEGLLRIIEGGY